MTIKSMLAIIACGTFTACVAGPYDNGYSGYNGNNGYSPVASGSYGNAPTIVAYGGNDYYGDNNAIPPGSYRDSCNNIVVRRGNLEATCGGDNGGRRSSIPLSSCRSGSFENINGNLQCMGGGGYNNYGGSNRDLPPGSYLQSCSEIGVRGGVLEATCGGGNNSRIRSSISLRSCRSGSFSNINGYLQCDR